jgi:hypothetical protein
MLKAKEDDICYSQDCIYGPKEHYHVLTPHGSYVKFIIRSKEYADTRGQWESHAGKD